MPWTVEYVDEFGEWLLSLPEKRQDQIFAAILLLQRDGPALRRPKVGKIEGSRHANMKELIPPGGHYRILFAFDPDRKAILPIADERYDRHLEERAREPKRTESRHGDKANQ